MSLKKDKVKVLGEHFDDERIKGFLDVQTYGDISRDYIALERAYRGMKADNFATFVQVFIDSGLNINATGPEGKTLLADIKTHRHGEEYAAALIAAGAQ